MRESRRGVRAAVAGVTALAAFWACGPASAAPPAVAASAAAASSPLWFDDPAHAVLTLASGRLTDGYGREVVLRGFNVSGESKLAENGGLPYASVTDAERSAAAMRTLTGADAVRFLITWASVEPQPGQYDYAYLAAVTAQIRAFTDRGIHVLLDFHQDLYSRYLFNQGSWYTGDGAPQWVVDAGGYPRESCGICVTWGQNITQNGAVTQADHDFWHNRVLTTPAGQVGVQDAFLAQAATALSYVKEHLGAAGYDQVAGVDPFNEPYAGTYDSGQDSRSWERDDLWPFYLRFRQVMDAAGWQDRPAYVEPNVFWNANLSFEKQTGGLLDAGSLGGGRFVFNTHFYDEQALSGVFLPGHAGNGQYTTDFDTVRQRAADTGTAALVSEFGSPETGYTSDKTPSVLKAMYQSLDSGVSGAKWWDDPAASGPVLSGTQWQWDPYSGRHHELMNGNPDKVQTSGDAWNGEDFSVVDTDDSGTVRLRQQAALLDRLYPGAVAGHTLAFTYEDRAADGSTTLTWNPVPAGLPHVAALVGGGQYGVLVWRSDGGAAPTTLHLPASFTAAGTTVVSDLGTVTGLPAYATDGSTATTPVAGAAEPGGAGQRLLLSDPGSPAGTVHYALVTNGSPGASAADRAAAQGELAAWLAAHPFTG